MQGDSLKLKLILLGESGVGKSSIIHRFVGNNFNADQTPTLGASFMVRTMPIKDIAVTFNIWDTAGQERYQSLARLYYRKVDVAVLVYDITQRNSYEVLKKWYGELREYGPKNTVVIIVANKEDLVESEEVDEDEASSFAQSIGAIYTRTSAKTNHGIDKIFKEAAGRILPELKASVCGSTESGSVTSEGFKIGRKKSSFKKKLMLCC
jgi:small GTP-binding protein